MFLAYAKNILSGGGWSFNYGLPSNGITSPLWLTLTLAGKFFPANLYAFVKGLSCLCGVGVLLLVWKMFFALGKNSVLLTSIFAISFSFSHWFGLWSISGMEGAFSSLILTVVVYFNIIKPHDDPHKQKIFFLSSTLLLINVFVRPETILLLFFYFIITFFSNYRLYTRPTIFFALCAIAISSIWIVFSLYNFHSFIPNTILVKQGIEKHFSIPRLILALKRNSIILLPELLGAVVVLFINIKTNLHSKSYSFFKSFYFVWVVWVISIPLLYIYNGTMGGEQATSRYLMPIIPMATFLVLFSLLNLNWPVKGKIAMVIVFTALNIGFSAIHYKPTQYNLFYMNKMKEYSLWIKNNTPQSATVAAEDFGLLAYYSERHVVDLVGLHYTDVLKYKNKWEYMKKAKPDYFLMNEFYTFPWTSEIDKISSVIFSEDISWWPIMLSFSTPPVKKFKLLKLNWDRNP
jgi:hypothetical protein